MRSACSLQKLFFFFFGGVGLIFFFFTEKIDIQRERQRMDPFSASNYITASGPGSSVTTEFVPYSRKKLDPSIKPWELSGWLHCCFSGVIRFCVWRLEEKLVAGVSFA